jgi:hypothetical protein
MEMGIASSLTLLAMTDRRFLQPEQCRERYGDTRNDSGGDVLDSVQQSLGRYDDAKKIGTLHQRPNTQVPGT